MAGTDGVILLNTSGADYVVNEDLTKPIKITTGCSLTFNNGKKLTLNDDKHDAIQVYTSGAVTIKNAKVVQSGNAKALRVDSGAVVSLESCDFKAAGINCIDVESGQLTVMGGTYEATSTAATALIRSNSKLCLEGGKFITNGGAKCIAKSGGNYLVVNGGAFNSLDVASYLGSNKVFSKSTDEGFWTVANDNGGAESDYYCVKLNNRAIAYFATDSEAKDFAAKVDGAVAVPITYTVSFNLNGGAGADGAYATQTVNKGAYAVKPSDPSKAGFTFLKWVTGDDESAVAFDFKNAPVVSNLTLKAVYAEKTATITYDANGGSFSDGEKTAKQVYKSGEYTSKLADKPSLGGKYFAGWTLKDGTTYVFGKSIEQDVTLKAKWSDTAVASCDGVSYGTLQDAFDAAKDGSTVTLLANVKITDDGSGQGAKCKNVKNLTFDLGMHEIKYTGSDADVADDVISFYNCENLKIQNGYVEGTKAFGIYLSKCSGYELSSLDVEVGGEFVTALNAYASSGKILGGYYEGPKDDCAFHISGGSAEIVDGAFVGHVEDEDDDAVSIEVDDKASLVITGGSFFGEIYASWAYDIAISGGSFDSSRAITYLDEGYGLLKREGENGLYDAVKLGEDGIPDGAYWSVEVSYEEEEGKTLVIVTVFYESREDAQAFYDAIKKDAEEDGLTVTLKQLRYKVSFQSLGEVVSTKGVRVGQAVGDLPAGEEVSGWTFSGWYLEDEEAGDKKVDASFVPDGDVTLVAKWVRNGSDEESDDPEKEDSGKDDSSDKDKKAIPQTGDSTNAMAFAALAAVGATAAALGATRKRQ